MLTAERLRQLLNYDPATGIFTWRVSSLAVKTAKHSAGYVQINLDHKNYLAHRLAWLWVHGEWPASGIDHKNANRQHNWIDNLRPATRSQNAGNARRHRDNGSGFKGIWFDKQTGRWRAQVCKDGKRINLGRFMSRDAAHAAYATAATEHFAEFARSA